MSTYTIDLEYEQIEAIVRAFLIDQIKMLSNTQWNPKDRQYEDATIVAMEAVLRYYSSCEQWDEYVGRKI